MSLTELLAKRNGPNNEPPQSVGRLIGNRDQTGEDHAIKTLPLTDAQREIWFGAQVSKEVSCSFNQSVILNLHGPLDCPRLTQTLEWLVNRHEALRVTFTESGDGQKLHPTVPMNMSFEDLSAISPQMRDEQFRRLLQAEIEEPFDLLNGPLFRVRLVKLAPGEHIVLLTLHHLICDGASLGVLLQEFAERYSAGLEGRPGPGPLALTYSKFVLDQNASLIGPDRAEAEAYWLQQYSRPAPALELPSDRIRPGRRSFSGDSIGITLGPSLTQGLKRLSAQQRCTLMTILLTAYYVLLHRLSEQEEIIIGLPMTCRSMAGGERLVGHCLNFLPLRLKVDGGLTFAEHVGRVWSMLMDAHEHSNFTLGSLLQKLSAPRDRTRMPLTSVMFNLDWVHQTMSIPGLKTDVKANPYCQARFDLSLRVTEADGRLELFSQFSSELFDRSTIERWLRHYESLLYAVAEKNPNEQISKLPLVSPADQHTLAVDWARWHPQFLRTLPADSLTRLFPFLQSEGEHSQCRVYVLDRNLQPCPVGVPGELFVSAPESLASSGGSRMAQPQAPRDPFRSEPDIHIYGTKTQVRRLPDGKFEVVGKTRLNEDQRSQSPATEKEHDGELPVGAIEETVAQIWREVIGLDELGRHDNFFDIGGHSLLATRVTARISKAFQVQLPVRTIFEAPTIAELAQAVTTAKGVRIDSASVITRRNRESEASKLLQRLEQLSDAELHELLQNPSLKDLI